MTRKSHTLDNGVTVLLNPNPNTEAIAVGYGVRVGARFETEKENGITHYLEHMAFKKDTPEESLKVAQDIEGAGGRMNAYTSRDVTFYFAQGLAEKFDTFNHHMSKIALDAVIPANELEIERGNIIGEIGQALDDPEDILGDLVYATAYPDQPIGRTILGPKENISRFQREDFMRFIKKHYHTGNVVVSLSGKMDEDYVLEAVKDATAHLDRGKRSKFKKAQYHSGIVHHEKDSDQLHLALCFNGASLADGLDAKAETILGVIMGGGFSSRLFQEIREKRGLGYSISAQAAQAKDSGLFSIEAAINPEGAQAFLEATVDEVKKILRDGVTEDEVARVKAMLKTELALGAESSLASMRSMFHTYDAIDKLKSPADVLAEFDSITAGDVKKAAERAFSSEPVLATIGPGLHMPKPKKLEKALKL